VFFVAVRNVLPQAFTKNNEVQALAGLLLLMAGIFQLSDSTQAVGAGLLRGIKDVKVPTILIGIAYWIVGIPSGYLFAHFFNMGAAGMWLGLILGLTVASLFLQMRFFRMVKKQTAEAITIS
jgi:MATE family multidrug resistance protein